MGKTNTLPHTNMEPHVVPFRADICKAFQGSMWKFFQTGNGDCKGNKGLPARYCIEFLLRNTHVSLGRLVEASGAL